MLRPGLVSVTFRALAPEAVIEHCVRAGLGGIEWGGDVHVPHGDVARARGVARWCADAGVAISAYGSYYRAGASEAAGLTFHAVLDTALALGAPVIRVWAGTCGSAGASALHRQAVVEDCRRICAMAHTAQRAIAFEFHDGTLADTAEAARTLLEAVSHPACSTYWQPPHGMPAAEAAEGLRLLRPWLSNLHVFHWWPDARHRLPLAGGMERWRTFLAVLAGDARKHWASLEFLPNDDPALLPREAACLRQLCAGANLAAPPASSN